MAGRQWRAVAKLPSKQKAPKCRASAVWHLIFSIEQRTEWVSVHALLYRKLQLDWWPGQCHQSSAVPKRCQQKPIVPTVKWAPRCIVNKCLIAAFAQTLNWPAVDAYELDQTPLSLLPSPTPPLLLCYSPKLWAVIECYVIALKINSFSVTRLGKKNRMQHWCKTKTMMLLFTLCLDTQNDDQFINLIKTWQIKMLQITSVSLRVMSVSHKWTPFWWLGAIYHQARSSAPKQKHYCCYRGNKGSNRIFFAQGV